MNSKPRSVLSLLAFIFALQLILTGCHTIRGAGEDVEAAGEAVKEGTEKRTPY